MNVKRITVTIDIDETNLETVQDKIEGLRNDLIYTMSDYSPVYNFIVRTDDAPF